MAHLVLYHFLASFLVGFFLRFFVDFRPLESLILVLPPAREHEFYKIDVFHFIGKFGPKIGGFERPKSM